MKVWEAIAMLEAMDPNKEVTVTIGRQFKIIKDDPTYGGTPNQPYWYPNYSFPPNTITCKMQ